MLISLKCLLLSFVPSINFNFLHNIYNKIFFQLLYSHFHFCAQFYTKISIHVSYFIPILRIFLPFVHIVKVLYCTTVSLKHLITFFISSSLPYFFITISQNFYLYIPNFSNSLPSIILPYLVFFSSTFCSTRESYHKRKRFFSYHSALFKRLFFFCHPLVSDQKVAEEESR